MPENIIRPGDPVTGISYADYESGTEAYKQQREGQIQQELTRAQRTSGRIQKADYKPTTSMYRRKQYQYGQEVQDIYTKQAEGLKTIDVTEYENAQKEKPMFDPNQIVDDPSNLVFGSYEGYSQALGDWTTKFGNVLGRGQERYQQSNLYLDAEKEKLKQYDIEEYNKALAYKPIYSDGNVITPNIPLYKDYTGTNKETVTKTVSSGGYSVSGWALENGVVKIYYNEPPQGSMNTQAMVNLKIDIPKGYQYEWVSGGASKLPVNKGQLPTPDKSYDRTLYNYDLYSKALSDWTSKFGNVLGRGEERFTESNKIIDQSKDTLKQINAYDLERAEKEKPSYLLNVQNPKAYAEQMNAWVEKWNPVLGRTEENYAIAQNLLDPTKATLTDTENTQLTQLQKDISKFSTYQDINNRLVTKAPKTYISGYIDGAGFTRGTYFEGLYEELDPKTMTVTIKDSKVVDWKHISGTKNREKPIVETRILGTYQLGAGLNVNDLYETKKGNVGTTVKAYVDRDGKKYTTEQFKRFSSSQQKNQFYDGRKGQWRTSTMVVGYVPDTQILKTGYENILNEYKGKTSSIDYNNPLIRDKLIASNVPKFSSKGSVNDSTHAQELAKQREEIAKKKAQMYAEDQAKASKLTVINPYTGKIQISQGRSYTEYTDKNLAQQLSIQNSIKAGQEVNLNLATGSVKLGTGPAFNMDPMSLRQMMGGQDMINTGSYNIGKGGVITSTTVNNMMTQKTTTTPKTNIMTTSSPIFSANNYQQSIKPMSMSMPGINTNISNNSSAGNIFRAALPQSMSNSSGMMTGTTNTPKVIKSLKSTSSFDPSKFI